MTPPSGWTMDPEELDYAGEWSAEDSCGYQLALDCKLGPCTPIMCRPPDGQILFESNGKYYLYDQIGGDLVQLTSPSSLDEIISVFKEGGLRSVKSKKVR